MFIKYEFVLTEVGGEKMLVPSGAGEKRYKGIITLNETAAFMWELLPEVDSAAELAEALEREYQVDHPTALGDAEMFLEKLRQAEII